MSGLTEFQRTVARAFASCSDADLNRTPDG